MRDALKFISFLSPVFVHLKGGYVFDTSKDIYSINMEDIQNVAEEELGRELSESELKIIEDKIGDYIDWYGAIYSAIQNEVLNVTEHPTSE